MPQHFETAPLVVRTSETPSGDVQDAGRDLASAGRVVAADDLSATDAAATLVAVGWDALEALAARRADGAYGEARLVARLDRWHTFDRGFVDEARRPIGPRKASRLLDAADVVACTEPGLARLVRRLHRPDALYWPSWPRMQHVPRGADRAIVVVGPELDPDGRVDAWRERIDSSIPIGSLDDDTPPGSLVVLSPRSCGDHLLLRSLRRANLLPCIAWRGATAELLVPNGVRRPVRTQADIEAVRVELAAEAKRAAGRAQRFWGQLRDGQRLWTDTAESPEHDDPLLRAIDAASLDAIDPDLRLHLVDELLRAGFDDLATRHATIALDLARDSGDEPVEEVRVSRRLAERRVWSPASEPVAAVLDQLRDAPGVIVDRPPRHEPPVSRRFPWGHVLGARSHAKDHGALRLAPRRSIRLLVSDHEARGRWWVAGGRLLNPTLRLDSITATTAGGGLPGSSHTAGDAWRVAFLVPASTEPILGVDLHVEMRGPTGQLMSAGSMMLDTARPLEAVEIPTATDTTPLVAIGEPTVAGATASVTLGGPIVATDGTAPVLAEFALHGDDDDDDGGEVTVEVEGSRFSAARLDPDVYGPNRYRADVTDAIRAASRPSQLELKVSRRSTAGGETSAKRAHVYCAGLHPADQTAPPLQLPTEAIDAWTDRHGRPAETTGKQEVRWLFDNVQLDHPAAGRVAAGALVVLGGPSHLGLQCLDGLQVELNGHVVDRVAKSTGRRRWRWIGRIRRDHDVHVGALELRIRSHTTRQISADDPRECSALLDRIGVGVEAGRSMFWGTERDLPFIVGGEHGEHFGRGIEGVWLSSTGACWIDIPWGTRALRIAGDAASSRRIVDAATVRLDDAVIRHDTLVSSDGSWELIAKLPGSTPTRRTDTARKLRIDTDPAGADLTLLISTVEARW